MVMKPKGSQWDLYHASTHWFKSGDTVNPTDRLYTNEPHAYATRSPDTAAYFGRSKAMRQEQQALFTPVFEVEHKSAPEDTRVMDLREPEKASHSDPKGFKVNRLAGISDWKGKFQAL